MRSYVAKNAHSVVEPFDLVNALKAHAPGADVEGVIDAWINRPELPECP